MKSNRLVLATVIISILAAMFLTTCSNPFLYDDENEDGGGGGGGGGGGTITIIGTPKTGNTLTASTTGSGWTSNYGWAYADSANASSFTYFSGANSSVFIIPSGYVGKYIRVLRGHPLGNWTDTQTGEKRFASDAVGPVTTY